MKINELSDEVILIEARKAAHRYRGEGADLLRYIQIVDLRFLYKDNYKSLFDWVEQDLKLADGSAHLRITAARLLNKFPQLAEKIDEGILSITTIGMAQTYFNENNIRDSLDQARIFASIEGLSKKNAEKKLYELSGKRKAVQERMDRVSVDSFKVTFELSEKTIELLKKIMGMAHKKLSYDEIIFLALTALFEKMTKKIFKETTERKSKGTTGRAFSNHTIRLAGKRAGYACEICKSTEKLQKDHKLPVAHGGLSTTENCRILCRDCNRREAIKMGLLRPGEYRFT